MRAFKYFVTVGMLIVAVVLVMMLLPGGNDRSGEPYLLKPPHVSVEGNLSGGDVFRINEGKASISISMRDGEPVMHPPASAGIPLFEKVNGEYVLSSMVRKLFIKKITVPDFKGGKRTLDASVKLLHVKVDNDVPYGVVKLFRELLKKYDIKLDLVEAGS